MTCYVAKIIKGVFGSIGQIEEEINQSLPESPIWDPPEAFSISHHKDKALPSLKHHNNPSPKNPKITGSKSGCQSLPANASPPLTHKKLPRVQIILKWQTWPQSISPFYPLHVTYRSQIISITIEGHILKIFKLQIIKKICRVNLTTANKVVIRWKNLMKIEFYSKSIILLIKFNNRINQQI